MSSNDSFNWPSYFSFIKTYPAGVLEERAPSNWLDCQKIRHGLTLAAYQRFRPQLQTSTPRIIDVGAYPGSLLKCLRLFLKESGEISGYGLAAPEAFIRHMGEYQVTFDRCNLDPLLGSYQSEDELIPTRIPRPDESCDCAFATEVIEHTLDPLYMLRELRRTLRPGGCLILSTPNQVTLSHRIRLLLGRSIYYHLKESIMYQQVDWRPHIREYTMTEMTTLVRDAGFEIVEASYMDLEYDDPRVWGWRHPHLRLAKWLAKPLMRIPSMRHNLLIVGRRI